MAEFQFQFQIYNNNSSCHELHIHLFTNIQLPISPFLWFFLWLTQGQNAKKHSNKAEENIQKRISKQPRHATVTILHHKYI